MHLLFYNGSQEMGRKLWKKSALILVRFFEKTKQKTTINSEYFEQIGTLQRGWRVNPNEA